ncbi:MAG: nuclear transport factor 2 family protein [Actinomycetota bacterium]
MSSPTAGVDAYVAAWNTADPDERRALLALAVTDDCEYHGPNGRTAGPAQLDAAIAEARDYVPGARVVRVGEVTGESPRWTFGWAVLGPGDTAVMQGTDVVETAPDGRLRRIQVSAAGD